MSDVLKDLTEAGVSVWLDDISRDRLRTGNLESLVKDFHVRGVTSNPTIFAHAVSKGNAYARATRTTTRSRTSRCAASPRRRRCG